MPRTLYEDYATATGQYTPSAVVDDFTLLIEIADLPAEWKAAVASDGADVRVHDNFNNELPHDLIEWTYVSPTNVTGWIRCKYEGELDVAPVVKVYAGDANATAYAVDYSKGQYAAYDENFEAYWPEGKGANRTSPNYTTSDTGTITTVAGQVGQAADFENTAGGAASEYANTTYVPTSSVKTFECWVYCDVSGANQVFFGNSNTAPYLFLRKHTINQIYWGWGDTAQFYNFNPIAAWHHFAIVESAGTATLYHNGVAVTPTISPTWSGTSTAVAIGAQTGGGFAFDGSQENKIHTTPRSAAWIDFEYKQTDDNADFWDSSWTWVGSTPATPVASGSRMLIGCAF